MAVVHKSVLVGYSAEQMFALVDRVEDYPRFLPWCGGVDVQRTDDDNLVASLAIHYHGIKQTFTTKNKNVRPVSMQMTLVDGPFKHLEGRWIFKSLRENACKIDFELNYEFSNKLLDQIIGPVFSMIANSFVDSFCKRAEAIYAAELAGKMQVQVCYATSERSFLLDVTLPDGASLHQAIKASGILQQAPEIDVSVWRVGIYGKLKTLDTPLHDHDRVEIYCPLIADPMESRRRRASKRGAGNG